MAALVVSGVALGGMVGLLTVAALGRRREETEEKDLKAKVMKELLEDESAGIVTGFSMEEAREKADSGHRRAKVMKPAEVLSALQKGNARFWMGTAVRPEKNAFERRALISKQFPLTAVLGCSDSRVPVEIVFDQGLGDMFVVRVAGNCLDSTTSASLEYAVQHLKVKVLMVLGHEGCGAIKAAQLPAADIAKEPECLGTLLNGLKKGLEGAHLSAVRDPKALDREAVTTNVKYQVEQLMKDEAIMKAVRAGELIIVGAYYEISSGIVDFFHEVSGSDVPATASAAEPSGVQRQPSRGVLTRYSKDTKL
eukprot:SRR837773.1289.p1 GENE.SRR837773.1289~~SRR837773.1289.p1  ORF type:complete len:333 (+),score=142.23 SRR837773.1289:75-1001(+)